MKSISLILMMYALISCATKTDTGQSKKSLKKTSWHDSVRPGARVF